MSGLALSPFTFGEDFSNYLSLAEWTGHACLNSFLSLLPGTCQLADRVFLARSLYLGESLTGQTLPLLVGVLLWESTFPVLLGGCVSRPMWTHLSLVAHIGLSEIRDTLIRNERYSDLPARFPCLPISGLWKHKGKGNCHLVPSNPNSNNTCRKRKFPFSVVWFSTWSQVWAGSELGLPNASPRDPIWQVI